MTLLERLRTRRVRILVQFVAAVAVAVAVGLAFVDNAVARAVGAALLGAVLLVVVKLAVVAIQGTAAAQAGVAAVSRRQRPAPSDLGAIEAAHADLRAAHEELLARCRALETELAGQRDVVETLRSLSRRVEPTVAETAVLQHEVTYLRETLERIQRTNGSG